MPDALAFYLSGQLLSEDYYVANKLMKGFFGTANVDTNSRLCMASSVAGHRRAFGADRPRQVWGSRWGRSYRVCRFERGLVPSRSLPADDRHEARAQRQARRHRSAADRDGRRRRLFLPIAPGMDSVLFAPLRAPAATWRSTPLYGATRRVLWKRWRRAREIAAEPRDRRATASVRPTYRASFSLSRPNAWSPLRARRQTIRAGHRQSRRDYQCVIWPRAASAGPA